MLTNGMCTIWMKRTMKIVLATMILYSLIILLMV